MTSGYSVFGLQLYDSDLVTRKHIFIILSFDMPCQKSQKHENLNHGLPQGINLELKVYLLLKSSAKFLVLLNSTDFGNVPLRILHPIDGF